MFAHLIVGLRQAGLPTSITEYLTLLGAMKAGVAEWSVDDFYYLSRATLVKDERHLDRFDRVFAQCFKGLEPPEGVLPRELPEEWLRKLAEKFLTPEEMAKIEALGGFEALMQRLAELLAEQKGRHQGGSKWIGTAGTSPFGAYGYNPEGVRIGQHESRHRRAVKVWDKRDFRDLDDTVELGTRNLKLALRRLRRFARQGAATELDLPDTITLDREECRDAGSEDGAGAAQCREGAAVPRHRRIDGRLRASCRRNCSRRRGRSSSIWSISTSTTSRMSGCGRTIAAGTMNGSPRLR